MARGLRGVLVLGWLALSITAGHGAERAKSPGVEIIAVGAIDRQLLVDLRDGLKGSLGVGVVLGQHLAEPDDAWDRQRAQYCSSKILSQVRRERKSAAGFKILAVIDHDLYVPDLNFVFGEASSDVAVISLARLRQSFYGLPEDSGIFYQRMLTEAVHELGHSYGLGHCPNPRCVMFFSNQLSDTDQKGAKFCPLCARQLGVLIPAGQVIGGETVQ